MREVAITAFETLGNLVEISLVECATARRRSFVAGALAPGLVARVEGWCASGEPLLLLVEESGDAQLGGPDATVTGLRDVSERV